MSTPGQLLGQAARYLVHLHALTVYPTLSSIQVWPDTISLAVLLTENYRLIFRERVFFCGPASSTSTAVAPRLEACSLLLAQPYVTHAWRVVALATPAIGERVIWLLEYLRSALTSGSDECERRRSIYVFHQLPLTMGLRRSIHETKTFDRIL